jgi:hypothetical protein
MRNLILVVTLLAGCSSDDGRFAEAPPGFVKDPQHGALRPRRATASEIVDAANSTNSPPEWFSEAERAAVEKVRR